MHIDLLLFLEPGVHFRKRDAHEIGQRVGGGGGEDQGCECGAGVRGEREGGQVGDGGGGGRGGGRGGDGGARGEDRGRREGGDREVIASFVPGCR